ncbi:MAG: hypothetical protein HQL98_05035 [Magnetococcales bacterium]|nr:hypothetical protein [Magnetococcales bacterium]
MIHILYSADYELYLGRICQPEHAVLIEPTTHLLAACERLAIPLTLFADVACLWRYREWQRATFPAQAEAQLVEAIRRGHDVQTHLHPHWTHARLEDNRYIFQPEHYLAGTFSPDPQERHHLIRGWLQRASDYLTTLLAPHVPADTPAYRCLAFRAGGYGLQPDANRLLQLLRETGYRIDSSIIPGARIASSVQQVDFSNVPAAGNYWLSHESGLTTPAPWGSGLFEIPIAAHRLTPGERFRVRAPQALRQAVAILTRHAPPPPRGEACNAPPPLSTPTNRMKLAYWRATAILANDFQRLELGTDLQALLTCFNGHVATARRHNPTAPLFVSLNIHPKGIHPAHLKTLAEFHHTLLKRHPGQIRAITFQQAWAILQQYATGSTPAHHTLS